MTDTVEIVTVLNKKPETEEEYLKYIRDKAYNYINSYIYNDATKLQAMKIILQSFGKPEIVNTTGGVIEKNLS